MFNSSPHTSIYGSPRVNASLVTPGVLQRSRNVTIPPVVTAAAPWILNPVTNALRFKSDRILSSELRGDEALDYIAALNSGHPGASVLATDTSCRRADRVTNTGFASAKTASPWRYTMDNAKIGLVPAGDRFTVADLETIYAVFIDRFEHLDRVLRSLPSAHDRAQAEAEKARVETVIRRICASGQGGHHG